MTHDRDLTRDLERWLEDAPTSAPPSSRATIRGRVHETRQRPWWLVRERGEPFERGSRGTVRLLAIGLVVLALMGGSVGLLSIGSRPPFAPLPSPEITPYSVNGQPLGIAVESGAVWVAMFDIGRVTRIDPETGATTEIDSPGRNCVGMYAGAGAIWVPSCMRGPLKRIDPLTNSSSEVAFEGQGQFPPIPFDGDIAWVTLDVDRGDYVRYDARAGEELGRGTLGGPGVIHAGGFGSGWATAAAGETGIRRIDGPTLQTITTIETALPPSYGVMIGDSMWFTTGVEGEDQGMLVRVDPESNTIVASLEFPSADVWPATDGRSLWILNGRAPARASRIDLGSNTIAETIVIGGSADTMAVDGDTLWVTRGLTRDVVRIDTHR